MTWILTQKQKPKREAEGIQILTEEQWHMGLLNLTRDMPSLHQKSCCPSMHYQYVTFQVTSQGLKYFI